ncbi:MAG: glycine cleavage system protein H [Deltaproteobacteria bacterium]
MTALIDTLTTIGVFVAGLAARLGIVLGIALVILAPVMLALGAGRVFRSVKMWMEGYRSAGQLRFRGGLAYAPGHTWVKAEGKSLKVGLDDLAQRILPWTVAVDMPREGQMVKEGEPVATLSCGERQVQVAAPTTGRIVAVNPEVMREPTLAKSENYGSGWLFAIEPANQEWKSLPFGETAREWLRAEGHRLERFYEDQLGMAAADGGELIAAPDTLLNDEQWKDLTRNFLRT